MISEKVNVYVAKPNLISAVHTSVICSKLYKKLNYDSIYVPLSKVSLIPLGLLIEINAWNLRVHLRSSPEMRHWEL